MKTELAEARLIAEIDLDRLPGHVAVIMDGNGRWARKRKLPRIAGHRAGIKAVRQVVEACLRLGVPYLTLYAFSLENWKRPESEVKMLMNLLREYLGKEIGELNRQNIRLRVIGRIHELPKLVQRDLERALSETAQNTGMILTFALNYGARAELIDAVRELVERAQRNGAGLTIDEETLRVHLYTRDMPDPDLLIRTSGEMRVSNFLLWQIAYSEIWVTETLWPDFTQLDLFNAVVEYQRRERRYGGLTQNPTGKDLSKS
ncbi:MAG TPA: isoprenyl transferase [Terriglobia bacterium]|nr:isoprenyl transferase [Terriglobia bacterium]